MTKKELLNEILKKRSGVDFSVHPELCSVPLLGNKIRMPARELLYVYFDLEREFGCTVPPEAVEKGLFDSFDHILELVETTSPGGSI